MTLRIPTTTTSVALDGAASPKVVVTFASDEDFVKYYREDVPQIWVALVGKVDSEIVGMGGVIYDEWGRAFGFFDAEIRPTFALHRAGMRFMKGMREAGETLIYAVCDFEVSEKADVWLRRLGFERDPDYRIEGQDLWKWEADGV